MTDDGTMIPVKSMETGNTRYVKLSALIGLRRGKALLTDKVGIDQNALVAFGARGEHIIAATKGQFDTSVRLTRAQLEQLHAGSNMAGTYLRARVVIVN